MSKNTVAAVAAGVGALVAGLYYSNGNGGKAASLAVCVPAFVCGWFVRGGMAPSIRGKETSRDGVDGSEGEEDDSEDSDTEYNDESGLWDPLKMVLCVRTDLGMKKGKMMAQCCHAAVGALMKGEHAAPKLCKKFHRTGSAKIALKCPSEDTMNGIRDAARELKLISYVVCDAGRTQIAAGSRTVIAIGPGPVSEIDKITGRNGLFPLSLM
jgi:peptidyl-tRNA hydrolase, PTH2 family